MSKGIDCNDLDPDVALQPISATQSAGNHSVSDEQPDFETAVFLRARLLPIIEKASCWADLISALERERYGLAIRSGHLVLTNRRNGNSICTGRFIGTPLAELSSRFGKPRVRYLPGSCASGVFLREQP